MTDCGMWRRLGRPNREEAEQLTDKVLDTAMRLFAERGYGATSIAAVATEARVGKHTIYRRYPDKAALFRACVERMADTILGARAEHVGGDCNPLEALHQLAHRAATAAGDPQMLRLYRTTIAEAERFPELAAIFVDTDNDKLVQSCAAMIAAAQQAGLIRAEDPLFLAGLFLEMTVGTLLHQGLCGQIVPPETAHDMVDRSYAIFLDGARP